MTFAFQGGEPTLMGLPFYRRLMDFIGAHNTKKLKVHLAIQANGLLISIYFYFFMGGFFGMDGRLAITPSLNMGMGIPAQAGGGRGHGKPV